MYIVNAAVLLCIMFLLQYDSCLGLVNFTRSVDFLTRAGSISPHLILYFVCKYIYF